MTTDAWLSAPFAAAGDTDRFGVARERVEAILSAQRNMWKDEPGAWTIIPLDRNPALFALVARDSEGERRGREVITAFVGPAIARLADAPLALSSTAPADVILNRHLISRVIPLIHTSGNASAGLLAAVERLVSVRSTRPEVRREIAPALPFLLRDYRLALQQGDSEESGRLYASIEQTRMLSSDNLRFLKVDRLASLGRWQELVGLPIFRDLARARRPRRISEELLEALWRARIASDDGVISARQALERFATSSLPEDYAALLRSIDVPTSTAGRRLVAVSAVLEAQNDRIDRLYAAANETDRGFIADLLSTRDPSGTGTTTVAPTDAPISIGELLALEDWEGVLRAAEESPGDPRAAEAAVTAAYEMDDPYSSRRAVALLDQVPDAELSTSRGFRKRLGEVRASAQDECLSWADWLRRVGRSEPWDSAAEVLRSESDRWDITEFTSNIVADAAGNSLLEGSSNVNAGQVLRGLDLLCTLARDLVDQMMGDPIIQAVMLVIGEQPNPSHQVREAFRGLLEPLLDSGPDAAQYAEYTVLLRAVWSKVQSRVTFDWGLDIADLLMSMPCPDASARAQFVQSLMSWALGHRQQLAHRQALMVNVVAEQAGIGTGLEIASVATDRDNVWARLIGTRVGLYSLWPKAGSRLQERLCELAGGPVTVEQSDAHVAKTSLTNLASQTHYMIVDTWHAKHSATAAIDAVLTRDQQILPRGGGVMSFLTALQDRIESEG